MPTNKAEYKLAAVALCASVTIAVNTSTSVEPPSSSDILIERILNLRNTLATDSDPGQTFGDGPFSVAFDKVFEKQKCTVSSTC